MQSLLPLLPLPLLKLLNTAESSSDLLAEQRFHAIVMFADIADFTALSDQAGDLGARGTEQLTLVLNQVFEAMIDLIQTAGGVVWGFSGDALTALFCYKTPQQTPIALQALRCSLAIQAAMNQFQTNTLINEFVAIRLTMKIGLAHGELICGMAGLPQQRLVPLLVGQPLIESSLVETQALEGEIGLTAELWHIVQPYVEAQARDNYYWLQRCQPGASITQPSLSPAQLPARAEMFIHPLIAKRLADNQASFINEHRLVYVLFAQLRVEQSPQGLASMREWASMLTAISAQYDGYLSHVTAGDKGITSMILFGAPIAHEDDPLRILDCALGVREQTHQLGYQSALGLTSGVVYCGLVGSTIRQDYTTIGDSINVAARLMEQAEPDQILVSMELAHHTQTQFDWQVLPAVMLKGKPQPIALMALQQRASAASVRLPEVASNLRLIGRASELATLLSVTGQALTGHGQIMAIVGDPGIGKSHLINAYLQQVDTDHWNIYRGECEAYGENSPYLVWNAIWRAFFCIEPNWDLATQIRVLNFQLELIDPSLLNRLPLLGTIFNLAIPANETTALLEPQMQKLAREAVLIQALRLRAMRQPLILILEDCHWIDPLSADLLWAISQVIEHLPICIILGYRPAIQNELISQRLPQLSYWGSVTLHEFNQGEASQLVAYKMQHWLGEQQISSSLAAHLINQAEGNPFYLEELLNYVHTQGLDLNDAAVISKLQLPASLSSLILSRIDQLNQHQQLTIKIASIIGRLFKLHWLWGVYPQLGDYQAIQTDLEILDRLDLTIKHSFEPEIAYIFKHMLTYEVTYESLTYATRSTLHEQFGHFLEQHYADDPSYLDVICYHFTRSDNHRKKIEYLWKAAKTAQQSYANEAALLFYRQLLTLLPAAEHWSVLLPIGEILQIVGKPQAAIEAYQSIIQALPSTADAAIKGLWSIGKIYGELGQFEQGLTWLEQARTSYLKLGNAEGVAEVLIDIANILWQQGYYDQGLAHVQQSLDHWRQLANPLGMARALFQLGVILSDQRRYAEAYHALEQSLALRREAGDLFAMASSLNDLGIIAFDRGDYTTAEHLYTEAFTIRRDLGFIRGMAQSLSNLANAVFVSGDYQRTRELLEQALIYRRQVGHQRGIAISLAHLGNTYAALGDFKAAWNNHRDAFVVRCTINHRLGIAQSQVAMGFLALRTGDFYQAYGLFQQSIHGFLVLDDQRGLAENLVGFGCVAAGLLKYQLAHQFMLAAETIIVSLNTIFEPEFRDGHAWLKRQLNQDLPDLLSLSEANNASTIETLLKLSYRLY
ncbi:MAG: tetratricopeptide repeat protein [Chloroflexi bacterium]|nr:tetratricopeptide repeat protein [Chloroflexota bacterium]